MGELHTHHLGGGAARARWPYVPHRLWDILAIGFAYWATIWRCISHLLGSSVLGVGSSAKNAHK